MSRAVVMDAIIGDSELAGLGFDDDSVLANYDGRQRPTDKMFIVLRWEQHDWNVQLQRGPRNLAIWVHMYREFSTDFTRIDDVIERLDVVLSNIIDTPGRDGRTVSQIIPVGRSRDLKDDGYQTFCRSTSYQVLSRQT